MDLEVILQKFDKIAENEEKIYAMGGGVSPSSVRGILDKTITEIEAKDFCEVTELGQWVFYKYTNLTKVVCPDTLKTIRENAFNGCNKLSEITLNEGLTEICYRAFQSCGSLSSICMPSTIAQLGEEVFNECNNITTYDFSKCTGGPPSFIRTSDRPLHGTSDFVILVPQGKSGVWESNQYWAQYAGRIREKL